MNDEQGQRLFQWWHALQPRDAKDAVTVRDLYGPFVGLGRADRAQLRRCSRGEEVMLLPAYIYLAHALGEDLRPVDLALVAGAVAHVRHASDKSDTRQLAELLGAKRTKESPPVMSQLRFEQLLASATPDELFVRLRRAIELVESKAVHERKPVNLAELATDLMQWCDELRGHLPPADERVRVRWASSYFLAPLYPVPAPTTPSPATAAP